MVSEARHASRRSGGACYKWGDHAMRLELDPLGGGTRLTLWTSIDAASISMGAAGWHICFDVSGSRLRRNSHRRMVVPSDEFGGWQRLNA